jgi:hypothetical protein
VTESARFTPDEERQVREQWLSSSKAQCPRCAAAMRERPITGGSFGLGYQRRREWLMCPQCRRSVLFDAARGTRN